MLSVTLTLHPVSTLTPAPAVPALERSPNSTRSVTFGFANPVMHEQLVRILDSTPIEYARLDDGSIRVTGHHEEAFDAAVDLVRQLRFPFWGSFRPFEASRYSDYLAYMLSHGIPFEEEIHGDHTIKNWFLVESGTDHYTWGIEAVDRP